MSGAQIRPGSNVSTQTAAGQPIAPAQMVAPRSQVPNSVPTVVQVNTSQKTMTQPSPMEAITNLTQNKQLTSVHHTAASLPSANQAAVRMSTTPASNTTKCLITTSGSSFAGTSALTTLSAAVVTAVASPVEASLMASPRLSSPLLVSSTTTAAATSFPVTTPAVVPSVVSSGDGTGTDMAVRTSGSFSDSQISAESQQHQQQQQQIKVFPQKTEKSPVKHCISSDAGALPINGITNGVNSDSPLNEGMILNGTNSKTDKIKKEHESSSLPNGTHHGSENASISKSSANHTHNSSSSSGPPKAMVKPQVLTHVIEGFVIHEASEPFPVNRSSILSDISKVRNSNSTNTATVLPQGSHIEEKQEISEDDLSSKIWKDSVKGDLGKCEGCGKVDIRSKHKKSKRFCSQSCAKRVCHAKSEEPSPKKMRLGEVEDEVEKRSNTLQEEVESENRSEFNVEEVISEEELLRTPKVDILKWTVRDVVEFIKNLPGCQDYAEDFELQEIDGQALMLLKADHLMSAMSIKLGPALKICAKIEAMRADRKEN
ncbi:Polyhomeotic-like protein 3 [Armadillidium nasatum]|uniref:Polyhomeotic-like protein 3 n=1 Tax=Armadillidium nasatum TaxID=96803 RepID=A0A5N5SZA5_9CRUS|nr:Polyhomeotic-like protein 3 [Armadillidium nasatum]